MSIPIAVKGMSRDKGEKEDEVVDAFPPPISRGIEAGVDPSGVRDRKLPGFRF